MLLNLLITLITCCIRQIENPSHSFNFLPANIALCRVDCARRPLSGAGSLRYFLLPSLAQSPAKDSPASKKPKNRLHGADHVKQTKKNEGMNRETTGKVHKGQQGANSKMRMLVYRERSYPAREVQGRDGSYTVAADSLVPELLDGIGSLDPAAFKLDEEIACYCSDEEIQKLADEELVEIIYEWQRL